MLYTNPRGSTIYGEAFTDLIDHNYPCQEDYQDMMDGVVIYAPPSTSDFVGDVYSGLPSDVASMLLNQNPDELESIRVLTPRDAFFRYGDAGRLGAVEIVTKRPTKVIRR